jgi:hypothetical protein
MRQFRVVIVRDLSQAWEEPGADRVVCAATAHAAVREVLRSLGGGFADSIEVFPCEPRLSRVQVSPPMMCAVFPVKRVCRVMFFCCWPVMHLLQARCVC